MADLTTKSAQPVAKRRRGAPTGKRNGAYVHGHRTQATMRRREAEWEAKEARFRAWFASRPPETAERNMIERLEALRRERGDE
jgi:hypothetical protein